MSKIERGEKAQITKYANGGILFPHIEFYTTQHKRQTKQVQNSIIYRMGVS